jgi:putative membrane protein
MAAAVDKLRTTSQAAVTSPMNKSPVYRRLLLLTFLVPLPLLAAEPAAAPTWHAQTLAQALGYMLLFAAVGIAAAVIAFKVFDKCTPGNLAKEILENKNVAAAIVAGAVILGVSLIIAASMLG